MVKKLTKLGNSYGVVIDKSVLDLLQIEADTPLEITTDGTSLVITPKRGARAARPGRFIDADEARRIARAEMQKHAEVLRKLAK